MAEWQELAEQKKKNPYIMAEQRGRIIHPSGNNYTATTLQRLV
jgi:hypothetical protein